MRKSYFLMGEDALTPKRTEGPEQDTIKSVFVVLNEKGLHTRPSTELVRCATGFKSEIHLSYQDYFVNAKSLLGILLLAAKKGAKICVEAQGQDAEAAVAAILALARNKFNIHY